MKKVQMISIGVGYLVYLLALLFGAFSYRYSPRSSFGAEMLQIYYSFALIFPVVTGLLFLLKKPRSFWLYVVSPALLSFFVFSYVVWMSPHNIPESSSILGRFLGQIAMLVFSYMYFRVVLITIVAYAIELACGWFWFKGKGEVWEGVKRDFRSSALWVLVFLMFVLIALR